jgi:hypothetical protein
MCTAEHEEFFIGQCDVLTRFDCGEGRAQTGNADNGDEYDVGLGKGSKFGEGFSARAKLRCGWKVACLLGSKVSFFVLEDCVRHIKFAADRSELIMAALCSYTYELKAAWVGAKYA